MYKLSPPNNNKTAGLVLTGFTLRKPVKRELSHVTQLEDITT